MATSATLAAVETVFANYGIEADEEVFREAEDLGLLGDKDVDAETLIAAALMLGHLDADGILAMMRAAAERALEG